MRIVAILLPINHERMNEMCVHPVHSTVHVLLHTGKWMNLFVNTTALRMNLEQHFAPESKKISHVDFMRY